MTNPHDLSTVIRAERAERKEAKEARMAAKTPSTAEDVEMAVKKAPHHRPKQPKESATEEEAETTTEGDADPLSRFHKNEGKARKRRERRTLEKRMRRERRHKH